MTKIKYILLFAFIAIMINACQDDDEYTLKKYPPQGGLVQADLTIESEKYLKATTEDVGLIFNYNRNEGKPVTVALEVTEIYPAQYVSAFTLAERLVTVDATNDTITVGQINWSVLDADSSLYVKISIVDSTVYKTGANTKAITVKFHKESPPLFSMQDAINKYFAFNATANITNSAVEIEVLNKPAEEEINIPLTLTSGLTEGTQFDITQNLQIPIGSTTATLNLSVYNSQFASNERDNLSLAVVSNTVPSTLTLDLSSKLTQEIKIGKVGEIIRLYRNLRYPATINPALDMDPIKPMSLRIKVSDYPVLKDLKIPLNLNTSQAKPGIHFLMDSTFITVSKGDTAGVINFELLPPSYDFGDTVTLYIEADRNHNAGESVVYDQVDYWTGIQMLKLDAYVAVLNKSATYDALIPVNSVDTVDVTVTIPDFLARQAPSDLDIPIYFNEFNLQRGTHFLSDGIVHVNNGETTGAITISVIAGQFPINGVNNKKLWIELRNDDLPETPMVIRHGVNWWTTINVGKQTSK